MVILNSMSTLGQLVLNVVNVADLIKLRVDTVCGGYVFLFDFTYGIVIAVASESKLSIAYVDLLFVLTINRDRKTAILCIVINSVRFYLRATDYNELIDAVFRYVDIVNEFCR